MPPLPGLDPAREEPGVEPNENGPDEDNSVQGAHMDRGAAMLSEDVSPLIQPSDSMGATDTTPLAAKRRDETECETISTTSQTQR